jgi:pimeloyl-ACP methyl ester carboxylesterase
MFARMTPDMAEMAILRGLYELHSPDGPEHWPIVFNKFVALIQREPNMSLEELGRISAPTLVLVGDDDLVSIEHTVALFRAIPNSELAVIPGASHGVAAEKPALVNQVVLDFLQPASIKT